MPLHHIFFLRLYVLHTLCNILHTMTHFPPSYAQYIFCLFLIFLFFFSYYYFPFFECINAAFILLRKTQRRCETLNSQILINTYTLFRAPTPYDFFLFNIISFLSHLFPFTHMLRTLLFIVMKMEKETRSSGISRVNYNSYSQVKNLHS